MKSSLHSKFPNEVNPIDALGFFPPLIFLPLWRCELGDTTTAKLTGTNGCIPNREFRDQVDLKKGPNGRERKYLATTPGVGRWCLSELCDVRSARKKREFGS